jgi:hypothetical protein
MTAADRVIKWTTAGAVLGVAAVAAVAKLMIPRFELVLSGFPPLARWLLALGIAATLAANVAHGLGHGPSGALVAAWPAVALVGSYELLMMIIRSGRVPVGHGGPTGTIQGSWRWCCAGSGC